MTESRAGARPLGRRGNAVLHPLCGARRGSEPPASSVAPSRCRCGDSGARYNAVMRGDSTKAGRRRNAALNGLHKSCAESQIYAELRGRCVYFREIVDKCPIYSCF